MLIVLLSLQFAVYSAKFLVWTSYCSLAFIATAQLMCQQSNLHVATNAYCANLFSATAVMLLYYHRGICTIGAIFAAGNHQSFVMFLLHDENGVTVCLLKKNQDLSEGADGITKGIITKWLTDASQTALCTYQHLIECLRRSQLGKLANYNSIEA